MAADAIISIDAGGSEQPWSAFNVCFSLLLVNKRNRMFAVSTRERPANIDTALSLQKKNKRMPLDAPCQPKSFHPPLACQTTLAVTSQWPPCQKYLLSSHNSLSSFLRYKAPLDSWGSANWTMRDGSGFNSLFIARRVFIRFFL